MDKFNKPASPILRLHIRLFQFLGYFNVFLNENYKDFAFKERLLCGWSLFILLTYSSVALYTFFGDIGFFFAGDGFGYFNDLLKLLIAQIAVTSSYLESVLRRKALLKFWNLYSALHVRDRVGELQNWQYHIWQHKRFLAIFYIAAFAEAAVMIIVFNFEELDWQLILFWSIFTPFIYAIHLRNMEFIFHLEIIRQEFVNLEQDMHLMVAYTGFAMHVLAFDGFEEFLRTKLLEKQISYQRVYEMIEYFQKAFGFSILAVMLMIYVRILVDTYFMYYANYVGFRLVESALIIPALIQIPAFLSTSKSCMNMVQRLAAQLHSIRKPVNCLFLSKQVQNFSLQLLHQAIRIDGVGIAPLDGYMLTRIVGSITTYMVFFIQFMPKFRNVPAQGT